jgi:sRNA-binding carbon storage regulator CsrA
MRVYTREVHQALVIDGDIRVTVVEVGDDFVRLEITDDRDETGCGHREEIVRLAVDPELEPVYH